MLRLHRVGKNFEDVWSAEEKGGPEIMEFGITQRDWKVIRMLQKRRERFIKLLREYSQKYGGEE